MKESAIQYAVRVALGREPDLALWRNSTGAVEVGGRWQRFGLVRGGADLVGCLGPTGRWFCLECKTDRGRLSEDQKLFGALVQRLGGFWAVARSVDEARDALERARRGENG